MVLILITYCKISKPDKVFRFSQIVQEKQTRLIFKSWLTNSSSELPEGSIIALKKVILIELRSLFINDNDNTEARQIFFQSHTDLYTVDIPFRSKSGNDIAASIDLSKYEFSSAIVEAEYQRKRGRSTSSTKGRKG
jgi:hypothetical protein